MTDTRIYPGTLYQALNSYTIYPGDRLLLRDGVYKGDFHSSLTGTLAKPITITAYPGEHPQIDGSITIHGGYTNWSNLEVFDSHFVRQSSQPVSNPTDIVCRTGIEVGTSNVLVSDCIIHDVAQGLGSYSEYNNCEYSNNIVYHCGWKNPSNTYGHGIYVFSRTAPTKIYKNLLFDNFGLGLHIYRTSGEINGFDIQDNIMFNNGSLWGNYFCNFIIGGHGNVNGLNFLNNESYFSAISSWWNQIGFDDATQVISPIIQGNYLSGYYDLFLRNNTTPTFDGNTICGNTDGFTSGDYPNNSYHAEKVDRIRIIGNSVVIYNASASNSVTVNLSGVLGLQPGDAIKLKNVQDLFVDAVTLVLDANSCISVDMRAVSHTASTPIGWTAPMTAFPLFGVFVIEKI